MFLFDGSLSLVVDIVFRGSHLGVQVCSLGYVFLYLILGFQQICSVSRLYLCTDMGRLPIWIGYRLEPSPQSKQPFIEMEDVLPHAILK